MKSCAIWPLFVVALLAGARARAEDRATYAFVFENDFLAGGDEDYTNGLRFVWRSGAGHGRGLARFVLDTDNDDRTRLAFGIGQSIFTPDAYTLPVPPPGQHPYAGWLYADAALIVEREAGAADILTFTLGVVGPAALGEQSQRAAHSVFGFSEPQGWDAQLRNEPGLVVSYDRQFAPVLLGGQQVIAHLSPFAGASLGNVMTEARAGARLSIGTAAPSVAARIAPSLPAPGLSNDRSRFAWSIFAGAGARLVAHNIFLDGNTFRDTVAVDRKPLIGDFEVGFSLDFGPVALGYTQVFRTKEYDTQDRRGDFAALTLTGRF
jgi:hypothetical protein